MNDVTIDDARDVEMKTLTSTITSGAAVCRIIPEESSQEFLKVFNDADLIVSKDQGNLESVVRINSKPTTVYLFRVKCDPIASDSDGMLDRW
jgi:uncharacterized protein with ATP-grasp and redox domains